MNMQEFINLEKSKLVTEDVATTASDIQPGNAFVGELIGRIYQDTIVSQVCDTQPCFGPNGVVFYSYKKPNNVYATGSKAFDCTKIEKIGRFKKEWFEDFTRIYKQDGINFLSSNISLDNRIDLDRLFINTLHSVAEVLPEVTFNGAPAAIQDDFMNILASINQASSKIATETQRGYKPYIIVSPNVGATLSTVGLLALDENIDVINKDYIGRIGKTRVFVDTYAESEFVLVGHHGISMGDSSFILCPYIIETRVEQEYSVDESGILIINRFGLVRNPLDTTGSNNSKFVKKIPVNFSGINQIDNFI